ncbi:pyrimidine utilization protein B [Brooklawnia cerclae]
MCRKGVSAPGMSDTGDMDTTNTAVLLIEFQNDFTTPGGALHDAVAGSMAETGMLANSAKLMDAAREAGATIIHIPISFKPGYSEITSHPYGILAGVVGSQAFVAGGWGAAITDEMTPAPADIVVEGKRGLDAFGSTNLDFILRSKGIQKVAIGGFLTNCCVESTMRTAYERGYDVVTLTDCVAATSSQEHQNAITYDYPMFSRPMTGTEFLAELSGVEAVADTSRGYEPAPA